MFAVLTNSDDYVSAVALYDDKDLADAHAKWVSGWVDELPVSVSLPEDVNDPVIQAERDACAADDRAKYQERQRFEQEKWERTERLTIDDFSRAGLCSCQTFSDKPMWTSNGYCRYCGRWSPAVLEARFGKDYVEEQIAELSKPHREAMCGILDGTRKPGLDL